MQRVYCVSKTHVSSCRFGCSLQLGLVVVNAVATVGQRVVYSRCLRSVLVLSG